MLDRVTLSFLSGVDQRALRMQGTSHRLFRIRVADRRDRSAERCGKSSQRGCDGLMV